MVQERQINQKETFQKVFHPNESILVNNNLGITVLYKHNLAHLSFADNVGEDNFTGHANEELFRKLSIGDLLISTRLNADNKLEIKIESSDPIQVIRYNYPQDFEKLFALRRVNGATTTNPSSADSGQTQ